MKYKRVLALELMILIIVLVSWSSSGQAFLPTKLHVTVIDQKEQPVESVNVRIYGSKADYLESRNVLFEGVTNTKGVVKFKGLEPKEYFVEARKEKMSNDAADVALPSLQEGRINKVSLTIL